MIDGQNEKKETESIYEKGKLLKNVQMEYFLYCLYFSEIVKLSASRRREAELSAIQSRSERFQLTL